MRIPDNILSFARMIEKEGWGVRVEWYDSLSWKVMALYGDKFIGLIVPHDMTHSMAKSRISQMRHQFGV